MASHSNLGISDFRSRKYDFPSPKKRGISAAMLDSSEFIMLWQNSIVFHTQKQVFYSTWCATFSINKNFKLQNFRQHWVYNISCLPRCGVDILQWCWRQCIFNNLCCKIRTDVLHRWLANTAGWGQRCIAVHANCCCTSPTAFSGLQRNTHTIYIYTVSGEIKRPTVLWT